MMTLLVFGNGMVSLYVFQGVFSLLTDTAIKDPRKRNLQISWFFTLLYRHPMRQTRVRWHLASHHMRFCGLVYFRVLQWLWSL